MLELGGRMRASKAEGRRTSLRYQSGQQRRSFKQGGFLVQGVRTQEEGIGSQRDKELPCRRVILEYDRNRIRRTNTWRWL